MRFFAIAAWLASGCLVVGAAWADEGAEPPLTYRVKVGDQSVTVKDGEVGQLDGSFANPRIVVEALPQRVFAMQGIRFRYPKSFTFDADLGDAAAKSWTLSGNDFKIMVFVLRGQLSAVDYAQSMIEQFGAKNAKRVDANATLTVGQEKLTGQSLHVELVGQRLVMDMFRLPSSGEITKLLVFQDNLDEKGQRSKEGAETLAEIKATLAVER